jgi:hypothetical protein
VASGCDDVRVNNGAGTAPTSLLVVRFGERPRQFRFLVALTVLVSLPVLAVNRYLAAAMLIVVPLILLVRFRRRALVVVRPAGPIVVKGWWHDTTVQPRDVTRAEWHRIGDSARLRLVLGDAYVDCETVAIPTGKVRPQDRGWSGRVDTLIDALEEVGVRSWALDSLQVQRG